jgi:ribose transport system substrate-binding protein
MRKVAWLLAALFGLVFVGATILNADLIAKSRQALAAAGLTGAPPPSSGKWHILVILPDSDDAFFTRLLEGIVATGPEVQATVQVERYANASSEDAQRWFDIGIRSRVDGIVMYAPRSEPVAERATIAKEAGVVFVAVGKDPPAGNLPCFIGSASLLQGYHGGSIIAAKLGDSARIGLILPTSGIENPEEDSLYRGVASSIAGWKGSRIVAAAFSQPGILSGEEAAADLLRSHPGINAIFCANSRDSLGAAQVLVDQNLVGRVLLIGADETPELLRYLDKGVIAASVVRDSRRIGVEAARAFASMRAGGAAPGTIEVDSTARLPGAKG